MNRWADLPLWRPVVMVLAVLTIAADLGGQAASAQVAYRYAGSMAPDQAAADQGVRSSYSAWRSTYVTDTGAGGYLRVRRPGDGDDTVSEGIGYGMLLAAYLNDKATFDGLWGYAKLYSHDPWGLMHWRIGPNGDLWGHNAATDADEDMALALIVADRRWGGSYGAQARELLVKILAHEVEANTNVLKPGDAWGGSDATNPSYFAPAYYKVFAVYTGETRWRNVADAAYQVIANLNAKTGAGATGLLPDWSTAVGERAWDANHNRYRGFDYSYDACRVPWRLAHDAAWYGDSRAQTQLTRLNDFWARVGPANIKAGYTLGGNPISQWHNSAFVAPAASGAIVSSNAAFRAAMWHETVSRPRENYYNDTLRMLGLLFMSGNMPNPLDITPTSTPGTTTFTSSANMSPATVAPGATTLLGVTVTAMGGPLTGGIVDVGVYNAAGDKVDQRFFTDQSFSASESRTYSLSWMAPGTTGTYTVKIGVFGSGWSPTYHWNNVAATITVRAAPGGGAGNVRQEVWTNIVEGNEVSTIPLNTPPNLVHTLSSLEAPTNWGDRYGTRIRGHIIAPTTRAYTFWLAADDNAELWLSTNEQPGAKQLIASVRSWTNPREWNRYASQQSAAIPLVAGQKYYLEVLHKEWSGGDNLAVGWLKPGTSGNTPQEVVPGSALSPYGAP